MYKLFLFISVGLFIDVQAYAPTYHLKAMFNDRVGREQVCAFMDNVLKQADSKEFLKLVDRLDTNCDDREIYQKILAKVADIKSNLFFIDQIKALNAQKKELARQIKQLLDGQESFNDCLEIGGPATYLQAISGDIKINGKVYALGYAQAVSDIIKAFKFNPANSFKFYDQFIPLNDYQPISLDIADASVDLVVCTIGLHHIELSKLDAFVASIARILKPNGLFILRDHDCVNLELVSVAFAAHSIFNAIATSETVESEVGEIRNFQPLNYWIELLAKHGLVAGTERLLQAGDSTKNTMLKFVKQPVLEADVVQALSHDLKKQDHNYERALEQTYLTSTEWFNVDVSQEYGDFINHTPFYEFPYFKSIATYWDIFGKSWQAAAKKQGHLKVLTSEHTFMSLFIGLTMTAEYTAKGILSWPVRMAISGEEPGFIKAIVSDPNNEIADFLDDIKVLEQDKFNLKTIELPRYKRFVDLLIKLAQTQVIIKEIAGQNQIQFKVRSIGDLPDFNRIAGCNFEYSWRSVVQPDHQLVALTVQLDQMTPVIKQLKALDVEILYIHDF